MMDCPCLIVLRFVVPVSYTHLLPAKQIQKNLKELCSRYHLELDPSKKIYQMAVGEKQTVEIVKALYRGATILILDEPTAVLTLSLIHI